MKNNLIIKTDKINTNINQRKNLILQTNSKIRYNENKIKQEYNPLFYKGISHIFNNSPIKFKKI